MCAGISLYSQEEPPLFGRQGGACPLDFEILESALPYQIDPNGLGKKGSFCTLRCISSNRVVYQSVGPSARP